MKKLAPPLAVLAVLGNLATTMLHAAPALAAGDGPPVTLVSVRGDDAHQNTSCQLIDSPCYTFEAALDAVRPGGQITCLDQGPFIYFHTFVINKSVTIDCEAVQARVIGPEFVSAITVQAAATDVVVLRGLDVSNNAFGSQGIWFQSGAELHIEKCVIHGFNGPYSPTAGIFFPHTQPGTMELFVSDTVVRNNNAQGNGSGIHISPDLNDTISKVILNHVEVRDNYMGIRADGNWPNVSGGVINMTVRDSVASGNTINGIVGTTNATGPAVVMLVDRSTSSHNGAGYGVIADGPKTTIEMTGSAASGNNFGIGASNGGRLISYQDNKVTLNSTDGSPTGVISFK